MVIVLILLLLLLDLHCLFLSLSVLLLLLINFDLNVYVVFWSCSFLFVICHNQVTWISSFWIHLSSIDISNHSPLICILLSMVLMACWIILILIVICSLSIAKLSWCLGYNYVLNIIIDWKIYSWLLHFSLFVSTHYSSSLPILSNMLLWILWTWNLVIHQVTNFWSLMGCRMRNILISCLMNTMVMMMCLLATRMEISCSIWRCIRMVSCLLWMSSFASCCNFWIGWSSWTSNKWLIYSYKLIYKIIYIVLTLLLSKLLLQKLSHIVEYFFISFVFGKILFVVFNQFLNLFI